jgi:ATP-binding cassette subfamily B protein
MRRIEGRIELRGVSFAYEPDQPVLQDIDLTIEAGQSVALIGETGAGKTTIANLISRFYDVTEGQVLIDGIDVRSVQQRTLRAQMALVSQDPFLFPGTIADNIRFGAPAASDDMVVEAAQAVGLHRFVERLPDGYDTQMLEFGTNISVGQRQLIAIARALIANPRLIVLDEATSSVDVITETVIQGGLRRLLQGRTAIIIAHRLSTVRAADCLFVIKDQGIVERGAHDELMALDGVYADLHRRQMGREER